MKERKKLPSLILLAAGRSSRMGMPKGLVSWNGQPWLFRQVENYKKAGGETVVLVLGDAASYFSELPELEKRLEPVSKTVSQRNIFQCLRRKDAGRKRRDSAFQAAENVFDRGRSAASIGGYCSRNPFLRPALESPGLYCDVQLSVLINPRPELGQFSSLKCAVDWLLESRATEALISPIDVPLEIETLKFLNDARTKDIDVVRPIQCNRGGHPVLLSESFLKAIQRTDDDGRLDLLIRQWNREKVLDVTVKKDHSFRNLNRREEWEDYVKS